MTRPRCEPVAPELPIAIESRVLADHHRCDGALPDGRIGNNACRRVLVAVTLAEVQSRLLSRLFNKSDIC